ncbi:hypothetical protein IVB45_02125 [Bradyrhizobium sp. 4]|uniref:hypothetical protein n=1 Tax=Bradyrhizobium sp. 4 TaxID=2782678 RepID=UPI001FFF6E37|nr:hypothetical protein [Bradyrhizobium sp. 4]UPJ35831.1 hypothetical protein IVB45_02125 [Bradyrhizobium sp. 4]
MFHANIKDQKLNFGPVLLKKFGEWLLANDGKRVTIELEKIDRTNNQNSYYWLYLGVIERETGENSNDLHEFFKRKLLPPVFKKIRGEEIKLPASTKDLDKIAFGEYLDKISALTEIPLPDPEAAGYISNYAK